MGSGRAKDVNRIENLAKYGALLHSDTDRVASSVLWLKQGRSESWILSSSAWGYREYLNLGQDTTTLQLYKRYKQQPLF